MGKLFFKRNGSIILTCIGAVGVIATGIATAKATPKAMQLLEEVKEEKGEELTKVDVVKTIGPAYIPAIAIGVSTIACIFGANVLNTRNQANIMSAYVLLSNSYREYRKKVTELYGEEVDDRIKNEMAKDQYDDFEDILEEDECLFYDLASQQYFSSPMRDVIQKVTMDDGMECYLITTPFDLPASYYVNL